MNEEEREMDVYENLKKHNLEVPQMLAPKGLYLPVNQTGNLLYLSGQGSIENGTPLCGPRRHRCDG